MRLKTFTASTLGEAMEQVRDTLGPDAIIVSTYEAKRGRGVQVRAAVDTTPNGTTAKQGELTCTQADPSPEMVQEILALPLPDESPSVEPETALKRSLVFHDFSRNLGLRLLKSARGIDVLNPGERLTRALELHLNFKPVRKVPARPIMLVGLPGSGKTSLAAKIVAHAVLRGMNAALLSTDTLRAGGLEQLSAHAGRMGKSVEVAASPEALGELAAKHLAAATPYPIVIDTPATNPFIASEIRDLVTFRRAASAEMVLVLPAGGQRDEQTDMCRIFAELGTERVMITQADTTRRIGGTISAVEASGLSFSHMSVSPYIATDLVEMTAAELTARIYYAPRNGTKGARPATREASAVPPTSMPMAAKAAS